MEAIKEFFNFVSAPSILFTLAVVQFALFVAFPRFFTSTPVAAAIALLAVAFFALGALDPNFREIVAKPDNVPILGLIFVFGYFTWYAMRKAVENDARLAAGKPTLEKEESEEKVAVFPYLIYIEFVVALFFSILLVVWSIYLKAPLEEPANPTVAPNPSKAPWYFLGLQEQLVYFDPWIAGVLFPTLIIIGLCALPYIDRDPKTSGYYSFAVTRERKWAVILFLFGFWILWILLIIYGTFLRGPNWNFFGPFEYWDPNKVVPLINVNLSEIVYIKWLGKALPSNWFFRELPGIVLILVYFVVPMLTLVFIKPFKDFFQKMGAVRYHIFMFLLLTMVSLPIKMYLRWAFNLKYIIAIPEFFFNI